VGTRMRGRDVLWVAGRASFPVGGNTPTSPSGVMAADAIIHGAVTGRFDRVHPMGSHH